MYRFRLGELECSCDTLAELQEAAGATPVARKRPVKKKKRKYHRRKPAETAEAVEVPPPTGRRVTKKVKRKKAPKLSAAETVNDYNVADLPFVKSGITWAVTEKIAKRLGKKVKNKTQLRMDLKARKDMGE